MRFRSAVFGALVIGISGGFFACGSRTSLPGDFDAVVTGNDDSGTDARKPRDSGPDTAPPPIDARPPVDANRDDCPDADATLVYLITEQNQLLSFYPTDGTFNLIGNITCPVADPTIDNPFSMAVDRRGTAYVEFSQGEIFKVSTATAACTATPFVPFQQNFQNFGMGFTTIGAGPAEQLFVAGDDTGNNGGNADLGSIDTKSYVLTDIAPFDDPVYRAELTGTGDGRLFAFWTNSDNLTSEIGEIDKTNGHLIGTDTVPGVFVGNGWAFGFWGGKFYTFTDPNGTGSSSVDEFDPVSKAVRHVADYPQRIVGAGVSTCAPQE